MEYSPGGYAPVTPQTEFERRSTTVLTLGIIGLAIFFLPIANIAGLIVSIVAVSKANKNRLFGADCGFMENSRNAVGRVLGIVGIVLNALSILLGLLAVVLFGLFAVSFIGSGIASDMMQTLLPIAESAAAVL